jgi:hypothetical protein
MTHPLGKVWYEGAIDDSRAARSRFGNALFEFSAEAKCAAMFWSFLVRLRPSDVASFAAALGSVPRELRYRSPTYFDNGTLLPMYGSAEDELAGRHSPGYERFKEREAKRAKWTLRRSNG